MPLNPKQSKVSLKGKGGGRKVREGDVMREEWLERSTGGREHESRDMAGL